MKLRTFLRPQKKKKRMNLSAILNSEYFFHRSIQIQMALNQDRILPRDYLIKKAKPKINTGKKKKIDDNKNKEEIDSSYEAHKEKDKKEIPDELDKILAENQKKFAIQTKKYQTLKEYNDAISGYWHYINKKTKKEERELLFKRYFSTNDKNGINLYSEHLQKFCQNIFKSNPLLMRKKNADMFFHYLSEFNKYYKNENKFLYVKQKIVLFLEKLRDFLEFVKIKADSGLDSISKDIKIKNSKFVKEMELKVKQELKTLKEKKIINNEKEIKESQQIIDKTKETLDALFQNKAIFEDPEYFDPLYNKKFVLKSRNFEYKFRRTYNCKNDNQQIPNINKFKEKEKDNYSPNKTVKMSTISTGFFQPDKNKDKSDKKKDEILIDDINNNTNAEANAIFKKTKIDKEKSLRKAASSVFSFGIKNNLIDILKNEPNKVIKLKVKNIEKIENEKNSPRESISSSIQNDNDRIKKEKVIQLQKNLGVINNNISSRRISEEENIAKILSNKSTSKIINLQKKSRTSSISAIKDLSKDKDKDKDISRDSINFTKKSIFKSIDKKAPKVSKYKSEAVIKIEQKNEKKERQSISSYINFKNQNFNYNLGKDPVVVLYEGIKDKQKIKQNDVENIKAYFKKSGKKINKNLKSMDIIRQAKRITERLDIEKKTKKVFQPHLTYEHLKRLDSVKQINKKLDKLDVEYLNHIFDYKSKSSDSLQLYNQ